MIDLVTLFNIIHECNLLAGEMLLPRDIAAHCSWHYEYTLQNYFGGNYDNYRIMYEEYIKMLEEGLIN